MLPKLEFIKLVVMGIPNSVRFVQQLHDVQNGGKKSIPINPEDFSL
jgi:hypothetical protein